MSDRNFKPTVWPLPLVFTNGLAGTDDGLQMLLSVAEPVIVTVVEADWAPRIAVRLTGVVCARARVSVAVKLAETAPAGSVMELGIDIAELFEESATNEPPTGAALD